jgi:hypothetical protein
LLADSINIKVVQSLLRQNSSAVHEDIDLPTLQRARESFNRGAVGNFDAFVDFCSRLL